MKNLNILVPCAGLGSRFAQAGYDKPKLLIDIFEKPMIKWVIDSINLEGQYIFLVLKEHYNKYNLKKVLNNLVEKPIIIQIDKVTEGAACTSLLAKYYVNNDNPLLICNSDQYFQYNQNEFLNTINNINKNYIDGIIFTFESNHPKWSYAKTIEPSSNRVVSEVAEKKVISNNATVGCYWYKKGSDYVKYAEQMINKNIRVNNEFYIAPIYNEFIQDKKNIVIFPVNKMHGLGTPEDLELFKNSFCDA